MSGNEYTMKDGTKLVAADAGGDMRCDPCALYRTDECDKYTGPSRSAGECRRSRRDDGRFIYWVRVEQPQPGAPTPAAQSESDPSGKAANEPGAKLDAGKPQVWLCISGFSRSLHEVARVTTVGANKYSRNGWKHVADGPARYMEAFGRHLLAVGEGHVMDDGPGGTGCLHKAQMIWNLMASLELELAAKETK